MIDLKDDDLDAEPVASEEPRVYVEICPKCLGSGCYKGYTSLGHNKCTKCQGSGRLIFKTSPEKRASNRKNATARRKKAPEDRLRAFEEQHPEVAKWWTGNDFEFARNMREAAMKWGRLTDGQMAAVLRCIEKAKEREAARTDRVQNAPAITTEAIEAAFRKAQDSGLKHPKITLANYKISPAPETGRNAGALYFKDADSGEYLGKAMGGKFLRAQACTAEQEGDIVRVCANPKEAVQTYGLLTGVCAICSRELTDPESIRLGVGPICGSRFGWS